MTIADKVEGIIKDHTGYTELKGGGWRSEFIMKKECAEAIQKYIEDAKPKEKNEVCDKVINNVSFEFGYNQALKEWEDNMGGKE